MSRCSPPKTARAICEKLRLFLEEICCNLCRFSEAAEHGVFPEEVRIAQESFLGTPQAHADIRVDVSDRLSYFVEVKYGYSRSQIVSSLARKTAQS
jgi:adenylate cyclase